MTLEELKNKKVTITVTRTFPLGEDLSEETLSNLIKEQENEELPDEKLLDRIKFNYYNTVEDIEDEFWEMDDYKVTIHD